MPSLGARLVKWMKAQSFERVVIVPGGGATADVVREWDQVHRLGEEKAHWLAMRAMTLNGWFLADLLPGFAIGDGFGEGDRIILDAEQFARKDHEDVLPHTWEVTSDSIAARLAELTRADELILLKSVSVPLEMSWETAASRGYVDSVFPKLMERAKYRVTVINFRTAFDTLHDAGT